MPFVTVYPKGKPPTRFFKFQAEADGAGKEGWRKARTIGNAGLAKRAWLWLPRKFKTNPTRPRIPGASRFMTIKQANVNGYIYENRLDYINKAMPNGWERTVEQSVGNRVMGMARDKLAARWRRAVGAAKGAKIPNEDLARFFTGE